MRIPRVHVDAPLEVGAEVTLGTDRSHYLLQVLRLKPGAALFLFNGADGCDYAAEVAAAGRRAAAKITAAVPVDTESRLDSQVIQGLARPDHVDWMLQKTTELGVRRLSLFNAARTQTPLRGARLEKKLAHWRGVVASACEQCGRARLPAVDFHADLQAALAATVPGHRVLLDFRGAPLSSLNNAGNAVAVDTIHRHAQHLQRRPGTDFIDRQPVDLAFALFAPRDAGVDAARLA